MFASSRCRPHPGVGHGFGVGAPLRALISARSRRSSLALGAVRARRRPPDRRRHREGDSPSSLIPAARGSSGRTARSARSCQGSRCRRRGRPDWCTAPRVLGELLPLGAAGRPNSVALGTGWSNVENAITQPSWYRDRQAGMCLKSPPIPCCPLHEHVAAHQDRRQEPLADRGLRVDRALRSPLAARTSPASGRSARTRDRGCTCCR